MRFIVQFTRKGKNQNVEVEADDKLEARTNAIRQVFGPNTFWEGDEILHYGRAVTAVERVRHGKRRFVETKRSDRYRVHVECLEE